MRKLAASQGRPFRSVLEETLQRGLSASRDVRPPVTITPLPLGVRRAILGSSLNQIYDQIEADSPLA